MSRARRWLRQALSLAGACALTLASLAAASQDLKYVETDQLRVVYFANAGEFIAPYATQCLVNGLDAQKARFGYVPDGGVSVLLQDFSDIGNANAIMGAPRNRLYFELSPPMLTFETYSPGERLYALANHELRPPRRGGPGEFVRAHSAPLARWQGRARRRSIPRASSITT